MHDNGRKCAQRFAGRGGGQRQGATLQQAAGVTATPRRDRSRPDSSWRLDEGSACGVGRSLATARRLAEAARARASVGTAAHACHDQRGSATPSVRSEQFGRTSSLAISTAASASAEWAWRKRPAFSEKAENGLRELSGLPTWARRQSSAKTGAPTQRHTDRRSTAPHPSPLSEWGDVRPNSQLRLAPSSETAGKNEPREVARSQLPPSYRRPRPPRGTM
jgi:hypothetical protein